MSKATVLVLKIQNASVGVFIALAARWKCKGMARENEPLIALRFSRSAKILT